MRRLALVLAALVLPSLAGAQTPAVYQLSYAAPGDPLVHVSLTLPAPVAAPARFVIPRAVPGNYSAQDYDRDVRGLAAFAPDGAKVAVARETDGPAWRLGEAGARVSRVEYAVDVAEMERENLDASDASKQRDGYVGLLGYSVFGYVEGADDGPVRLEIDAPAGWPAFTTLAPQAPPAVGRASADAKSYYALADSQIVLGPRAAVRRVPGRVPLYLVVYAETAEDLDVEGQVARAALDAVVAYLGPPPFAHYTVFEELLRPISPRHEYGFSMEHLESGTFFLGLDRALTAASPASARQTNLFNYAHHMAHSWIPKHAYGEHYFPHRWEIEPVIDTIWFNEGFGRYAAIEAVAGGMPAAEGAAFRARSLARLRAILDEAPPVIRRMSLVELSRVASFLYLGGLPHRDEHVRARRAHGGRDGRAHPGAERRREEPARRPAVHARLGRAGRPRLPRRGVPGHRPRGHRRGRRRHLRPLARRPGRVTLS